NSSWRFLSVLYALVLIVLGTAFPLAEIISPQVQRSFIRHSIPEGSRNSQWECWSHVLLQRKNRTGSFFLRMGAILFGIGSMLYSCLEFGQYFELQESSDACGDVLAVVTPGFRFLFCFVQLYFIFTNFRIRTDRFTSLSRFGLMHMMATNVCIWLSVLVEETKHELQGATMELQLFRPNGFLGSFIDGITNDSAESIAQVATTQSFQSGIFNNELRNSTYADASSCRSRTTVGNVLQQASPFLYPCIVEHSLICAALTYVMWSRLKRPEDDRNGMIASLPHRKRQQYTVDCHGATRGLFIGILMSLMTIISMTLFFVWIYIWHKDYYSLSVFQAYVVETILYTTTLFSVFIACCRIRSLKFDYQEGSKLDDVLLIISQMGVYVFPTFILISAHHTISQNISREEIAGLVSTLLEVFQSTAQTLFLLDATRRRPSKARHIEEKPGREFVTFLLVCNFNLWAIDSMEAWRQQLYPQQLRFYGTWTWTLITHISMPLTIFYRFHSSVCLSEVWKSAYKKKNPADEAV
ncbi:hypothetical protein BV898_09474, partial [Hypsibius exemplaris]